MDLMKIDATFIGHVNNYHLYPLLHERPDTPYCKARQASIWLYWIWTSMEITLFNPYSIPLSALNSKGCFKKFAGFLEHPLCYLVNSLLGGGVLHWLIDDYGLSFNKSYS